MLLRYAILGLLDDQELHGYRIKSAFEERVGPLWPLNFGQIYQTLKDLRGRGLIEGRFDRGTGHIGRWVYTITAKGRRALATWLQRSPRRPQPARDEMLVRLLVLDSKEIAPRIAQVTGQERVYRDYVAALAAQRKSVGVPGRDDDLLKMLAMDAAMFQAEAHLRWLAHCSKLLKRPSGQPSCTSRIAPRKTSKVPQIANAGGVADP
jgi:DNA-binding PadR family transcriptional regulator